MCASRATKPFTGARLRPDACRCSTETRSLDPSALRANDSTRSRRTSRNRASISRDSQYADTTPDLSSTRLDVKSSQSASSRGCSCPCTRTTARALSTMARPISASSYSFGGAHSASTSSQSMADSRGRIGGWSVHSPAKTTPGWRISVDVNV